MPRPDIEVTERVLYSCPSCREVVWDVDTGNPRRCLSCGDVMLETVYVGERLSSALKRECPATVTDADVAAFFAAMKRIRNWTVTPAAESFPSISSSLPVARCPECGRKWER